MTERYDFKVGQDIHGEYFVQRDIQTDGNYVLASEHIELIKEHEKLRDEIKSLVKSISMALVDFGLDQ